MLLARLGGEKMDLASFLNENYYMLVPALWVLGFALKRTPSVPNWSIVWVLLGFSIVFGVIAWGFSYTGIINAIIAAGIAVLGHQMVKQSIQKK